jgi:DMSO/TMAO reductase YedYZ molybdopterin-dependent catalytic subunit
MSARGPFNPGAWRSPLRGPWLASILSSALLPLILICAITGLLSHAAYEPRLGDNELFPAPDLFPWRWPRDPAWLYGLTQGLHVIAGLAAIPILLAKLWTVIPKLFEVPPVRSPAHALERIGLALLVGGSLFVFATGVLNIQLWYPFGFSFVPAHYWAALAFLGALAFHVATKVGVARTAFRENGVVRPLREDLEHTRPEPELGGAETSIPKAPRAPTISRRALLGTVAAGSAGLGLMGFGQVAGGPFRRLAFLAPRGDGFGAGPNDFQVNKAFAAVNIPREQVTDAWALVLEVDGERRAVVRRQELLAMEQTTAELPIACVEGWTTTQTWTGVRLSELARLAGASDPVEVEARSLQPRGAFRRATLSGEQIGDPRSLLALKVNGARLSLDHGFPARVIVPALPGVHNTKWVGKLVFKERA